MSDLVSSHPPPRLFCDICDIFDAHDTDDCPIQEQDDDGPPPTQYHESRHTDRAYCDTCEGEPGRVFSFSRRTTTESQIEAVNYYRNGNSLKIYLAEASAGRLASVFDVRPTEREREK